MPTEDVKTMELTEILKSHWGYDDFRPLQREAIEAVIAGRDSVVVLPTGGGKSICYQVPALAMSGLAIVVSPLISLMKDQVDALLENGIAAAAVHSGVPAYERQQIANQIRGGELKLLYVAPERLMTQRMLEFLAETTVSFIAIDEAHCISDWGHNFRPEYRMLGELREHFPEVGLHGFTATATQRVREDIAQQLHLNEPRYHVGNFDRPNLRYSIARRSKIGEQLQAVLSRHEGDSGIIYCISRKQVDETAARLKAGGVKALPYHAGLSDEQRRRNQEAFLNERVDIIVATVAFGMGIDKSNVRFVVHAAAPKSIEHYQQESGRAGRDGLESECCLFYSGSDFALWRRMLSDLPEQSFQQAEANLRTMQNFCQSPVCRHRALVEHFGQEYAGENCGACDVCLDEVPVLEDSLVVAQKILSCVVRVNESYGADHVAAVLTGSKGQRILDLKHDQLSTYGLLKEHRKAAVRDWIEQLCGQEFARRVGDFNVLKVTPKGREVLRGEVTPKLLIPIDPKKKATAAQAGAKVFPGADAGLFEALRGLRRRLAEEHGVPPFVVFGDVTLQELSAKRPSSLAGFASVYGVGQKKLEQYGQVFVDEVVRYCEEHSLERDVSVDHKATTNVAEAFSETSRSPQHERAVEMFSQGASLEEVEKEVGRARSTLVKYLTEFLVEERIDDPQPWVAAETFQKIAQACDDLGGERLRPIFDHFDGEYTYDELRIGVTCWSNRTLLKSTQLGEDSE